MPKYITVRPPAYARGQAAPGIFYRNLYSTNIAVPCTYFHLLTTTASGSPPTIKLRMGKPEAVFFISS
jgi:hypothetical protein